MHWRSILLRQHKRADVACQPGWCFCTLPLVLWTAAGPVVLYLHSCWPQTVAAVGKSTTGCGLAATRRWAAAPSEWASTKIAQANSLPPSPNPLSISLCSFLFLHEQMDPNSILSSTAWLSRAVQEGSCGLQGHRPDDDRKQTQGEGQCGRRSGSKRQRCTKLWWAFFCAGFARLKARPLRHARHHSPWRAVAGHGQAEQTCCPLSENPRIQISPPLHVSTCALLAEFRQCRRLVRDGGGEEEERVWGVQGDIETRSSLHMFVNIVPSWHATSELKGPVKGYGTRWVT